MCVSIKYPPYSCRNKEEVKHRMAIWEKGPKKTSPKQVDWEEIARDLRADMFPSELHRTWMYYK